MPSGPAPRAAHRDAPARRRAERRAPLLFRRAWLPESAVGASLLVVHGYAEHSGRYEELGGVARRARRRGPRLRPARPRPLRRRALPRRSLRRLPRRSRPRARRAVRDAHRDLPVRARRPQHGRARRVRVPRRPAPAGPGRGDVGRARHARPRRVARAHHGRAPAAPPAPRLALGSGLDLDGLSRDPEVVQPLRRGSAHRPHDDRLARAPSC